MQLKFRNLSALSRFDAIFLFIYTIIDALRATVVLRLHSAANDAFLYINVFIRRQEMRNLAITSIKKPSTNNTLWILTFLTLPFRS